MLAAAGPDVYTRDCAVSANCPARVAKEDAGDWLRQSRNNDQALPYNATNGTKSHGDIFRLMAAKNITSFKTDYPFEFD